MIESRYRTAYVRPMGCYRKEEQPQQQHANRKRSRGLRYGIEEHSSTSTLDADFGHGKGYWHKNLRSYGLGAKLSLVIVVVGT